MMTLHGTTRLVASVALALVLGLAAMAAPAGAKLTLTDAWVSATGSDGTFSRQAGAHADLRSHIEFAYDHATGLLAESPKDIRVDLPPGVVGNPKATPTCSQDLLVRPGDLNPYCPPETQIGIAYIGDVPGGEAKTPVYNLEHSADVPGLFGINFLGVPVFIQPQVRPDDYGITAGSYRTSQTHTVYSADVTLWAVPSDPSHDHLRYKIGSVNPPDYAGYDNPSTAPRRPFLSNPTFCDGTAVTTTISANSWQVPDVFDTMSFTEDLDGTPFINEGCEKLAFDPTASVRTLSHTADAPTGLDVDLAIPYNDSPDALATANVKKVRVTLPEGMSVSPSAATALGACSPQQLALGTNQPITCPSSSKIGTIEITTPVLDDPITGDIVVAQQNDNPSKSVLALYIVAQGPGFMLKLAGRVDADPVTGRLTATFDGNPQLPFDHLRVAFRGGSQAALATPRDCGTYNAHIEITSWASDKVVSADSPITIDQGCDRGGFAPSFSAGSSSQLAGSRTTAFSLQVVRPDGQQHLRSVTTVLPRGLLANIGSVPLCAEADAAAGTCPAASRVGGTVTQAGPGATPFQLPGDVFLTGPYKGGPYGLAIVVRALAGPFDLGTVVVRAAINVDPVDAHVTVVSDDVPDVLTVTGTDGVAAGFPLRIRSVVVNIDRQDFMMNPTSCGASAVTGTIGSWDGATAAVSAPFRVGACAALPLEPDLAMTLVGKGQTTDGKHPTLNAHLVPGAGDANSRKVTVSLPLSLALDPGNANGLCEPADAAANKCAASTVVGHAKAFSVLRDPLTGPVYFVRGERKDPKSGRTIKTLPKLFIPLSADGVTIYVNASSDVKDKRLVTTFDNLPDAPFSSFDLQIDGGKHGILAVSGANVCAGTQIADAQFTGQNDKIAEAAITMGTPCALGIVKTSHTSTALKAVVGGVGAGKLSVTGKGLAKVSRTITSATTVTVAMKLAKSTRRALARGKDVKVKLSLAFTPKGAKKAKRAVKTVVLHGAAKR
jgi:hypothetical protein